MSREVVRWGRSAYETDADLALEAHGAARLGLRYRIEPDPRTVPPLRGVAALVVNSRARVRGDALAAFEGELVLTTTSGWDHIDVEAASRRGLLVGRCPLARRDAVVEHALAEMVGLTRRLPALNEAARRGHWARGDLPTLAPHRLRDAPVLVVGTGVIGRALVRVLQAMDVEVWGVDPLGVPDGVRAVDLDEALPLAGAVTLHCALSPTSRGLMTRERVARMAPSAVLVNTARGDVLDVEAAIEAVASGRLRGVACDVYPEEPYPGLRAASAVPGVHLTPHASGYGAGLGRRVADEVVAGLEAWVEGRALPFAVHA